MKTLAFFNIVIFTIGVFAPCLKVTPHLGDGGSYDFLGKLFYGDSFNPVIMSIFDTIYQLLKGGDYFIGAVILVFTILFPVFKMFLIFEHFFTKVANPKRIKLILSLSKYSMLDVFVIGLILLSIKVLPGGSTAQIQLGSLAFAANVLLTKLLLAKVSRESTEA